MLNSSNRIIKHKTGLLNLAEELGNVLKACRVMGYSRDLYTAIKVRWMKAAWKRFLRAHAASPIWPIASTTPTEQTVIKSAIEFPAYGRGTHFQRAA